MQLSHTRGCIVCPGLRICKIMLKSPHARLPLQGCGESETFAAAAGPLTLTPLWLSLWLHLSVYICVETQAPKRFPQISAHKRFFLTQRSVRTTQQNTAFLENGVAKHCAPAHSGILPLRRALRPKGFRGFRAGDLCSKTSAQKVFTKKKVLATHGTYLEPEHC